MDEQPAASRLLSLGVVAFAKEATDREQPCQREPGERSSWRQFAARLVARRTVVLAEPLKVFPCFSARGIF